MLNKRLKCRTRPRVEGTGFTPEVCVWAKCVKLLKKNSWSKETNGYITEFLTDQEKKNEIHEMILKLNKFKLFTLYGFRKTMMVNI